MFVEVNLESILSYLDKLNPEAVPSWGEMNAQRMVEHLSDAVRISSGENPQKILVPEEKLESMLRFLQSDKPIARNIEVPFASKETPLRNEEFELAVDELVDVWLAFEEHYSENEAKTEIHPFYGPLNLEGWQRLHSKHFTHHFEQFNLIEK